MYGIGKNNNPDNCIKPFRSLSEFFITKKHLTKYFIFLHVFTSEITSEKTRSIKISLKK